MHPLQRVWLFGPWSLQTFDALISGLEAGNGIRGTNLREVHLWTMEWNQEGTPGPTTSEKQGRFRMNAGLGSSEDGSVERVGIWLSNKYSSTRTFGSVTAQVGVVVFCFGGTDGSNLFGSALPFSNRG